MNSPVAQPSPVRVPNSDIFCLYGPHILHFALKDIPEFVHAKTNASGIASAGLAKIACIRLHNTHSCRMDVRWSFIGCNGRNCLALRDEHRYKD